MQISVYTQDLNNANHRYVADGRERYIKASNDLVTICVGNKSSISSRLTSVAQLGDNITTISSSSFENFPNLQSVSTSKNIRYIEKNAFRGCGILTYVDFLDDSWNGQLYYIDDQAFENTNLKDITLKLKGGVKSSSRVNASFIGNGVFQNCTNLTAVNFAQAPYIGSNMFKGCYNLKKVTINSRNSYLFNNAFEGCFSLETITLPQKFEQLPDQFFKDCISLTSVNFEDGSGDNASEMRYVGAEVFTGCEQLTSVTLPSSIRKYTDINPAAFAGSNLKRIRFNGFSKSDIALVNDQTSQSTVSEEDMKVRIKRGVWLKSGDFTGETEIKNVISYLALNGNPFGFYIGGIKCPPCDKFKENVLETDFFKNYMSQSAIPWFYATGEDVVYNVLKDYSKEISKSKAYPIFGVVHFKNANSVDMEVSIWDGGGNNGTILEIDTGKKGSDFFDRNVKPLYIGVKNTQEQSPTKEYDVPTGAWIKAKDTS